MFAETPAPPYTAVIFTSERAEGDDADYADTSARMEELAAAQAGYLGIESVFDPTVRRGITVSYWATDEDARAWKRVAEHAEAQRHGRERWYTGYRVRVATVTRAYGDPRGSDDGG
jgi:heme-degrading monooxygenase HmoA